MVSFVTGRLTRTPQQWNEGKTERPDDQKKERTEPNDAPQPKGPNR
jgi:hypothetical protein